MTDLLALSVDNETLIGVVLVLAAVALVLYILGRL